VTPFGTVVMYITRPFLISQWYFPYQTDGMGTGLRWGQTGIFGGLLNFSGEINGKHPTWNKEEQTESYNLRTDFMRIAVCWCLMASFGVKFPQPQE